MKRNLLLEDEFSYLNLRNCSCRKYEYEFNLYFGSFICQLDFSSLIKKYQNEKLLKRMTQVIVLNFCLTCKHNIDSVRFIRNTRYWKKDNCYNYWNFSYEFVKFTDILEENGLIDIYTGRFFSKRGEKTIYAGTKIQPTQRFLDEVIIPLAEKIDIEILTTPIVVHKKLRWREESKEEGKKWRERKKTISIPIDEIHEKVNHLNIVQYNFTVKKQEAFINKYNSLLERFDFSISDDIPPEKKLLLNECMRENADQFVGNSFYRVFNYKEPKHGKTKTPHWFKFGGRYYGHWIQALYNKRPDAKGNKAKLRSYVLIDGKKTVELDYSCLHANMLYALVGAERDHKEDIYKVPGEDISRDVCKRAMLIVFNASGEHQAAIALGDELEKDNPNSIPELDERKRILRIIRNTHQPIKKYFFSGIGLALQNIDGHIATQVIEIFIKKEKPIIPIHDSFIVLEEDEELLRKTMLEQYQKVLKTDNRIGID